MSNRQNLRFLFSFKYEVFIRIDTIFSPGVVAVSVLL